MDGRQEQVYDSDTFDDMMFFYTHVGAEPLSVLNKYKIDMILTDSNNYIQYHIDELKDYFNLLIGKNNKTIVFKAPTGSGKTFMLSALFEEIVKAESIASGFINNKTEILVKIIVSQTLFMVQYMLKKIKYERIYVDRYTRAFVKY